MFILDLAKKVSYVVDMMANININQKETNEVSVNGLVKKPQIAKLLTCSPRQVDNYMAQGMPHQKPSPRKVTFDSAEVLKWYKDTFGLQRRKPHSQN